MRECRITPTELRALQAGVPGRVVAKMKAAGFVFESETCPVKLARPYDVQGDVDTGELIYRQDDSAGAAK
jgi:hypothetical protein